MAAWTGFTEVLQWLSKHSPWLGLFTVRQYSWWKIIKIVQILMSFIQKCMCTTFSCMFCILFLKGGLTLFVRTSWLDNTTYGHPLLWLFWAVFLGTGCMPGGWSGHAGDALPRLARPPGTQRAAVADLRARLAGQVWYLIVWSSLCCSSSGSLMNVQAVIVAATLWSYFILTKYLLVDYWAMCF